MWLAAPLPAYGSGRLPEMSVPAGPAVSDSLICLGFLVLWHQKTQTYTIQPTLPGRIEYDIRGCELSGGPGGRPPLAGGGTSTCGVVAPVHELALIQQMVQQQQLRYRQRRAALPSPPTPPQPPPPPNDPP